MASTAAQVMGARGADVATITPGATLRDAAAALARHRIGALVVTDDARQVVGILSERDIVRHLAKLGAACLDADVASAMTGPVATCVGKTTTDDLMSMMTDGRFRHVPIVDDVGRLEGIVSIGDVVKSTIDTLQVEKASLTEYVAGGY